MKYFLSFFLFIFELFSVADDDDDDDDNDEEDQKRTMELRNLDWAEMAIFRRAFHCCRAVSQYPTTSIDRSIAH